MKVLFLQVKIPPCVVGWVIIKKVKLRDSKQVSMGGISIFSIHQMDSRRQIRICRVQTYFFPLQFSSLCSEGKWLWIFVFCCVFRVVLERAKPFLLFAIWSSCNKFECFDKEDPVGCKISVCSSVYNNKKRKYKKMAVVLNDNHHHHRQRCCQLNQEPICYCCFCWKERRVTKTEIRVFEWGFDCGRRLS